MQTDTRLTLPEDLTFLPVADLNAETRSRLDCQPDDFAISLPRSRIPTVIVDPDTAGLLQRFRQPRSLVDAVILYSLPRQLDARQVLEGSLPVVESFLRRGLLVDADQPESGAAVRPSFEPGESVAGLTIVRAIQVLADTELYLVRLPAASGTPFAALKLRRDATKIAPGSFRREAEILEHLDGRGAPRLLRRGDLDGRPYLLLEWWRGVESETAGRAEREQGKASRDRLLALAVNVARAYAGLHLRGVLHGDVHPRNVLVDAAGEVRLIDFGLARRVVFDPGTTSVELVSGRRPGVAFFFEPEHARALLDGGRGLEVSSAGEQYAVAALLYRLLTGNYTCDFRLERQAMLRQLAEEPPLPFAERGVEPWPEVEAILTRALARQPEERFATMSELAAALAAMRLSRSDRARRPRAATELTQRSTRLLRQANLDGPWLSEGLDIAPTAALVYGAAGIARGLLQIACRRGDAELLALADRWSGKALSAATDEAGFVNSARGIERSLIGHVSPYHTLSGIHGVAAGVARARGDQGGWRRAAVGFVAAVEEGLELAEGTVNPDLTLGHAGVLLHAVLLGEGMPTALRPPELAGLAERQLDALGERFRQPASIQPTDNLAIAHGWAGMLYAVLQWCRATNAELPPGVERRLDELAALAEPAGRGQRWPWLTGDGKHAGYMPGWCNGSAGFVFLWTLAWQLCGEVRFLDLAVSAAWDAWEAGERIGSLCCGLVGRSYALLNLYRHTNEHIWLTRARDLALRAAREDSFSDSFPHSLYKGDLALVVLAADLEQPEEATMPFFEEERWPSISEQADEAGIAA